MITGRVNLLRRPSIIVALVDRSGSPRIIEAHLDTGFSGDLTLPKVAIEQLSLDYAGLTNYQTGGGAITAFDSYEGIIQWHGTIRHITVLESESFPLVGINLLWDNNLSIDFKHGGGVAITELTSH